MKTDNLANSSESKQNVIDMHMAKTNHRQVKADKQELLSALIDGELNADQSRDVLDELLKDGQLKTQWQETHRANSIFQNKMDDNLAQLDVSANVSSILANEPAHFVENAVSLNPASTEKVSWQQRSGLFKAGVGVAVAATVMFVTLNISQLLNYSDGTSGLNGGQMAETHLNGSDGISQGTQNQNDKSREVAQTEMSNDAKMQEQNAAAAYVATQLPNSSRLPFAQTATFSQWDNQVSGQTVSSHVRSFERKKQYPLSEDNVMQLSPIEQNGDTKHHEER